MVKKMADLATQQVKNMQPARKEPEKGRSKLIGRLAERRPLPLFGTKPQPEPIRDGTKAKEPLDFFKALKVEPIDLEKKLEKEMGNKEFVVRLRRRIGDHPGDKKILDAILG